MKKISPEFSKTKSPDYYPAEVALSVSHQFPMDILVRSPQQVAKRLRMGDSFYRDIVENGVVLYERPGG